MKNVRSLCSLSLLTGLLVGMGCWNYATEHCGNLDGNETCAAQGAGYCDICLAEQNGCTDVRPEEGCAFVDLPVAEEGGMSTTIADDDSTGGSLTTSGNGAESGATTEGGSGDECRLDTDCQSATRPFCGAGGECVSCDDMENGDAACAAVNSGSPVCTGEACVPCTTAKPDACPGPTPVCGENNTCESCSEHDHCGTAACNLYTGLCLPSDAVVHVGPGLQFASLPAAAANFGPGAEGTIIVHQGVYNNSVTVDDGRTLAFLAHDGNLPVWSGLAGARQLSVTDGTVFLDGLSLSGNGGKDPAVQLAGEQSRVWADRSRIVANVGGGLLVENDAALTLRNCFVGGDAKKTHALEVRSAMAAVSYSTLIAGAGGNDERALWCSSDASLAVSDSILLKENTTMVTLLPIQCTGRSVHFNHSASEQDSISGVSNVGNFDETTAWFTDVTTGDFTLTDEGAPFFAGIARWNSGEPPTDILGNPRPDTNGALDYAGAHAPPL